jgi:chromosome segregation protein
MQKNQFETADTKLNQVEKMRSELQSREAEARSISSEAGGIEKVLQAEADAITRLLRRETSEVKQIIDQIQVTPGYELALGAAFQDDLKNPELGEGQRTGWVKMSVEDGDYNLPDGVKSLSSIVKGSELISRRLTQVGIVDPALGGELQNDLKPGQRLVSMDGGLWRWDGFTVDASDLSTSSALRLKQLNRLEELKKELSEATAKSEGAQQAHRSLQDQLLELTETDKKARVERQEADRLMTDSNRLFSNAESEKNISEGKVENLLLTVERYKNELLSTEKRLSEANNTIGCLDDLETAQTEIQKLKITVENSRTNMIAKRSVSDTISNENELTLRRLDKIEEQFVVWTSRFDLADKRINELRSRLELFDKKLKIEKERPNEILNNINNLDEKLALSEKLSIESTEKLAAAEALLRQEIDNERNAERNASEAREERARNDVILETAINNVEFCLRRIFDEYGLSPEELRLDLELTEKDISEASILEEKVDRYKRQRDGLGAVNLRAEEDAKEVQDQYDAIRKEKEDLAEAIKKLRSGISSLNREGRERILTAFEQVNENFNNLFKNLFSGGDGKLVMVESDDPLDAGLEIMCQPPGKKLSTLSLLSGGEQTLTALALIFAVFLANPAPLCVLDEVDAPLDDSNITRFCDLLDEMIRQTDTRFLIITHHAITMSRMDRLFGVTMGELGVSQLVSVDLKKAETLVA